MRSSFIAVVALSLVSLSLAASNGDSLENCPVRAGTGDYSYDPYADDRPERWGMNPEYTTCRTGQSQSPIDFPTTVKYADLSEGPDPMMNGSVVEFVGTPSNWALNCKTPGTCGYTMYNGAQFDVVNIHFHAPSEHTLNGTSYPLEAHIVHSTASGVLAVIITMFEYPMEEDYATAIYEGVPMASGTNGFMKQVLNGVQRGSDQFKVFPGVIMNPNFGFCGYVGSLTTPPCTEGVTFLMQLKVQKVSRVQVHDFLLSAGYPIEGNNRPIQPTNGRDITCYV